jgi:hypothetical protein
MRQPPGTGWALAAADVLTLQDAPVDKLLNVRPRDTYLRIAILTPVFCISLD